MARLEGISHILTTFPFQKIPNCISMEYIEDLLNRADLEASYGGFRASYTVWSKYGMSKPNTLSLTYFSPSTGLRESVEVECD